MISFCSEENLKGEDFESDGLQLMFSVFSVRKCTFLMCLLWVCQNMTNIYFLQRISTCHIRRSSPSLLWIISKAVTIQSTWEGRRSLSLLVVTANYFSAWIQNNFKTAFKIFFNEKKMEEDGLCYLCKPLQRCHFCRQKISWKPSNFHLSPSTYWESAVALVGGMGREQSHSQCKPADFSPGGCAGHKALLHLFSLQHIFKS